MISSSNSEGFREQFFDQIGGLLERHVAIALAMNDQHRPSLQWRRWTPDRKRSMHDSALALKVIDRYDHNR